MRMPFIAACGLATAVTACSFIPVEPGSESVRLDTADRITACKAMGTTTSTVLATVAGIRRSDQAIESDLFRLSANVAVQQGGNVLVPTGRHENGRQTFNLYRCP